MHGPASRRIVVTGASSGIGRELAIQLAEPGCEIWLVGRNAERLDEVAGEVEKRGGLPKVAKLDLRDLDGAGRYLKDVFPSETRVDELYLAAAVTQFGEVCDTLPEDWDQIYETTLMSSVQWTLHFYGHMVEAGAGRIVLISSLAAYTGYPTAVAYATMKAGLVGLFRSLVFEGKSHNVAVHIASPGYVKTRIYESAIFRKTSLERTMNQIESLRFPVMSAERTAKRILASVRRGKIQFALPFYASLMRWVAVRMPFVIEILHARIVKKFRQRS